MVLAHVYSEKITCLLNRSFAEMTVEEIRKGAPSMATHHMTFSYGTWYLRKHNGVWQRWVFKKEWWDCKPHIFLRLFKIKPLN